MTRTLALLIEYDGTHYAGWQHQPNGLSIQEAIERAVAEAFGVMAPVVGSGRTDAGVHARGQVAHVHIEGGHDIPIDKVPIALNVRLPRDIRIRDARDVAPDFHARYGAVRREYVYTIAFEESVFHRHFAWKPDLPYDRGLLGNAARAFVGTHDFTTYSKLNADTRSYVCDVAICRVEPESDRLVIRLQADRFVYGMCRAIVGAMMDVARGKAALDHLVDRLAARDRRLQSPLAPPQGLVLNRVSYPDGIFDEHRSF